MFSSYKSINKYNTQKNHDDDGGGICISSSSSSSSNQCCFFLSEFYKDKIVTKCDDVLYTTKIQKYDFYCKNEIEMCKVINQLGISDSYSNAYLNILVGYEKVNIKEVVCSDECIEVEVTNNIISPNQFVLLRYRNKCTVTLCDFLKTKSQSETKIFKRYVYDCLKNSIGLLIKNNIVVINFDILLDITGFSVVMSNFSRAFILDENSTRERKTMMNKYFFNSYDIRGCIHMPPEYHLLCFMNHHDIEVLSRNNIIQFICDYSKHKHAQVSSIRENDFICEYVNGDFTKIIKTSKRWPLQQLEKMLYGLELN